MTAPAAPAELIQTVGRRKEAVVRVRLVPGTGQYRLNGRTLEQYFPNKVHQQAINEPFVTLEKTEQYDVVARLHGGGVSGQAGALRLAIARALIEAEPDDRPALKKEGFLTRDARIKERKKYGLKKARRASEPSRPPGCGADPPPTPKGAPCPGCSARTACAASPTATS